MKFHVPQKGKQLELLRLAKNNSAEYAALKNNRTGKEVIALEQLGRCLGLKNPPKYIEAYDISNLSSESMVAGMVVFEDGRPLKKAYKRFTIKEQQYQNDYGSMQETLRRRLTHIVTGEGDEYFTRVPDLILLDGGKGHVHAVEPVIRELGLNIPGFGMVKETYASELTSIRGIGEKKAAKLMLKYKTRENLECASPQELASAVGVSAETGQELWNLIHS